MIFHRREPHPSQCRFRAGLSEVVVVEVGPLCARLLPLPEVVDLLLFGLDLLAEILELRGEKKR